MIEIKKDNVHRIIEEDRLEEFAAQGYAPVEPPEEISEDNGDENSGGDAGGTADAAGAPETPVFTDDEEKIKSDGKYLYLLGKDAMAAALTERGIPVAESESYRSMQAKASAYCAEVRANNQA